MLPKKFVRFLHHAALALTLTAGFGHADVTTFSLDATGFTYTGSAQGPNVIAAPSGIRQSTRI